MQVIGKHSDLKQMGIIFLCKSESGGKGGVMIGQLLEHFSDWDFSFLVHQK